MDLIKTIMTTKIDNEKVAGVQALYDEQLPDFVKRMISFMDAVIFINDSTRLLSYSEVLNASEELDVDFHSKCIIPLLDVGDNDFISFGTKDGSWFLYNIVDDVIFSECESLGEFLS